MIRMLAVIYGVIFALLGLLGFVSNPLIGANALFAADTTHNLLHLALGALLLLVASRFAAHAALWLKIVGAVTFLLGLVGLLAIPALGGSLLGIAYTNGSMNWFHLIAGMAVFFAPVYGADSRVPASAG